jgi:hypothetical protein
VVTYLGDINQAEGAGVKQAAEGKQGYWQSRLFDAEGEPDWVEVDTKRVHVGRVRDFGGYWLGLQMLDKLELPSFLEQTLPNSQEDIEWYIMSLAPVLWRLCEPSSELHIEEHLYDKSPLGDLLGIPDDKMNDNRLYRSLDNLLPNKSALEKHLKVRLGELFDLEYDMLLYDITSVYFEGERQITDKLNAVIPGSIVRIVSRSVLPLWFPEKGYHWVMKYLTATGTMSPRSKI